MRLLFLFLFILMSCVSDQKTPKWHRTEPNPSPPINTFIVHIDDFFTDLQRQEIAYAIYEWEYALNGQFKFIIREKFDWNESIRTWAMFCITSDNPRAIRNEKAVGITTISGNHVWFVIDRIEAENVILGAVTKHEIGHVLGAYDRDASGLLMSSKIKSNEDKCVDYEAVSQVAKLHNLDMSKTRWCY